MALVYADIEVGRAYRSGSYEITYDEVIDFAQRYDPQAMHLDPNIGATSPVFQRLAASGVHVLAIASRLQINCWNMISFTPIAGLGIREMRLLHPVYPGDALSIHTEFESKRLRRSVPNQGVVISRVEMFNQNELKVMEFHGAVLVAYAEHPAA